MNCSSYLAILNNGTGNVTFPTNSDITGIGVRIALYVSTFLGFLTAFLFPTDLEGYRDAARTALVTSTSMVIAAIYARYTSLGISLIDAQIVTMFITAITACYYTVSQFDFGFTTRIAVRLHQFLAAVFGILVYYDVNNFGGTDNVPECPNDQFLFVLFSRTVSATNPGLRIFALLVFAIFLAELILPGRGNIIIGLINVFGAFWEKGFKNGFVDIAQKIAGGRLARPKPLPQKVSAGGIVVIIYLIVTVEQMVKWNGLDAQGIIGQWTFGQTIAVVMLLDQCIKTGLKIVKRWKEALGSLILGIIDLYVLFRKVFRCLFCCCVRSRKRA